MQPEPHSPAKHDRSLRQWIARLGVAGVAFFFLKGLAWLIVPVVLVRGCSGDE